MDIEQFYAENEKRRASAEIEFGSKWTDVNDNYYELSWVEDTGELYLMLGPNAHVYEDLFFGEALSFNEPITALLIRVIGTLGSHDAVEAALLGWQDAMAAPHSLGWLAERFVGTEEQ